jgi:hypothetical protein
MGIECAARIHAQLAYRWPAQFRRNPRLHVTAYCPPKSRVTGSLKSRARALISASDKPARPPFRLITTSTRITQTYGDDDYGRQPLYCSRRARARGPEGRPAGQEGRAAAKYDAELRVEAARVEGAALYRPQSPHLPPLILYSRLAY